MTNFQYLPLGDKLFRISASTNEVWVYENNRDGKPPTWAKIEETNPPSLIQIPQAMINLA